jgi:PAS domain S-box-containing protein
MVILRLMNGRDQTVRTVSGEDAAQWFFENSRDLFCVAGPDRLLSKVNRAWTEVTGWAEAELLGRSPLDFVHPDDRRDMLAMARPLALTGETRLVTRFRTRDGRWLWFDGRNRLAADGCLVSVMRDITVERAREEELTAFRRDQAMLTQAAGIASWAYDPLTDKITWSPDFLALIDWPADKIDRPAKFLEILSMSQRDAVSAAFTRGVETGEGATVEHDIHTRDGRLLTMRATFRTERRGALFALKGISQNVTELVSARDDALHGKQRVTALAEELATSSVRLKMALAAAEAGAFEIDHPARTLWGSDRFYELMGRHILFEDIAPLDLTHIHAEDHAAVRRAQSEWVAGAGTQPAEFRVLHPGGGDRWVKVFYTLNQDTRRGVGLVMDIDAGKRQELALIEAQQKALAAGEAKARFLANMSHELRTPMNGVLGVMHLLEREALSDEGRSLLAEALGCGRMLTALLDDVVDFSRIEEGRLDLTAAPVEVGPLVEGVVRLLTPQAAAKDVALTVEGSATIGWAVTDGVRLRQALFNLIGNAVKFTLKGHVAVRCRRDGDQLVFEIEDSGVGIPLEVQAGLFERFQQGDASTTRQFGGSGLGLAITGRLAGLMGGKVEFVSVQDQGTTFTLTVKAAETEAVVSVVAAESTATEAILAGLKVLVVEDNPTNRMIAVKLLECLGATAETARDGVEGIEAAGHGRHDLILMDIQMPDMDGMEATRRIRSMSSPVRDVPIIALTANVMAHQRANYLAAGMNGVVSKPLSPAALLAEIGRIAEAPAAEAVAV